MTRWRGIPDLLAGSEAHLIDDQNPTTIAHSLEELAIVDAALSSRKVFLEGYRVERFVGNFWNAIATIAKRP